MLEREADGSYTFEGIGIRATIARNGDVSFGRRYLSGPRLGLGQPVDPAANKDTGFTDRAFFAANTVVVTGSLDYDFTLRHDAEKRWFLERTRALRDQLAERARRPKDLLGVLKSIWSGAGNFADHRRATLVLWANLSDDEVGTRGRGLIADYIATHCPPDSGCAFGASELHEFNRGRSLAFAPYQREITDAGPAPR